MRGWPINRAGYFSFASVFHGTQVTRVVHPMKTLSPPWLAWALLSAFFAALTAVFAKIGVQSVNANFATFIRTLIILILTAAIVVATRSWQAPASVSSRTWLFLLLSGLATGASWFCYFHALRIGEASAVAPVDKLSVVFVAVFSVLFLGERLSPPHWLGIAMITGGAVLIAWRT